MRRVNLWLLVLLALIAVPYYWFLIDRSEIGIKAKPLAIEQLRELAASLPGQLPTQIRYRVIGTHNISGNLITAGAGVMYMELEILAFQINTPHRPAITIDGSFPLWSTHASGPSRSSETAHFNGEDTGDAAAAYAIAPGIVAIPVGGMPQGTRMLYVRTADGREYLFTGNVAPIPDSWQRVTPPARWVTSRDPRLNRAEIVSWLKTIHTLKKETPSLSIVEGSDRMLPATFARGFVRPVDKMSHARTR